VEPVEPVDPVEPPVMGGSIGPVFPGVGSGRGQRGRMMESVPSGMRPPGMMERRKRMSFFAAALTFGSFSFDER